MKTIAFTGHRPSRLIWKYNENSIQCRNFKNKLYFILEKEIIENKVYQFLTGMALGIDMIMAEIIIKLKEKYPIKLIAVIPYQNQTEKWKLESVEKYNSILNQCDNKIIISQTFSYDSIYKRNEYLVDNCDYLYAFYTGGTGGTKYTIDYAKKLNKKVIIINPNT